MIVKVLQLKFSILLSVLTNKMTIGNWTDILENRRIVDVYLQRITILCRVFA